MDALTMPILHNLFCVIIHPQTYASARMTGKIILAIGMPRAGSGWHYNLVHDLIVAAGGQDAHQIRQQHRLGRILTEVNCNIGALTTQRIIPVTIPALLGNTFVIKAHAGPKPLAMRMIRKGLIQPTYIYRDPRDALLSAYEYGQRKRAVGRQGPFADLESIETAIDFMQEYVQISESWLACDLSLNLRYEELLSDYDAQVEHLIEFFDLVDEISVLQPIIDQYRPDQGSSQQKGTHFVKGKIGRYRQKLTRQQQQLCLEIFGDYLTRMGYPLNQETENDSES
jgi:hypothetical protein